MIPCDVLVIGRICIDFFVRPDRTTLESGSHFGSAVGGFAGNVSIGLARLGVPAAIISGVGNDGHGRRIISTLQREGVLTTFLRVDPEERTALAFCEVWPPSDFPITYYRPPTSPDWAMDSTIFPWADSWSASVRAICMSGTGLAHDPSREFHYLLGRSDPNRAILDLDWREQVWPSGDAYGRAVQDILPVVRTVVGTRKEVLRASGVGSLDDALQGMWRLGVARVLVKEPDGSARLATPERTVRVPGPWVEVVNGLGSGDAFLVATVAARIRGADWEPAMSQGLVARAFVAQRFGCSVAMPTRRQLAAVIRTYRAADPGRQETASSSTGTVTTR